MRKVHPLQRIYSRQDRQDFLRFFGFSIGTFWNSFIGFDIVKFEKLVLMPAGIKEDQSISEFLLIEYGPEQHELIDRLNRI